RAALVQRRRAVDRAVDRELPPQRAILAVHGVDPALVGREVQRLAVLAQRGCRPDAGDLALGLEQPGHLSVRVDGVEVRVVRADVYHPVRRDGRRGTGPHAVGAGRGRLGDDQWLRAQVLAEVELP